MVEKTQQIGTGIRHKVPHMMIHAMLTHAFFMALSHLSRSPLLQKGRLIKGLLKMEVRVQSFSSEGDDGWCLNWRCRTIEQI
jgi:hypothetical protein